MQLSYDGPPETRLKTCHDCGGEHEYTTGFLLADDNAYAVYWADWYPHANETYLDIIIGSWFEPDYEDHVTFGCRIGAIGGSSSPQCSLVHGGKTRSDSPMFGHKLTRDDALSHPRLQDFWDCVDWIIVNDPLLHEHVYHADGS